MKRTGRILMRVLFVAYLAAIVFLCLWHFKDTTMLSGTIFGLPKDKVGHFLMFFPFCFLLFAAYDKKTETVGAALIWAFLAALTGAVFAALTEAAQGFLTTTRTADPKDFLTDCLAIVISCVIIFFIDVAKQCCKNRNHEI